MAIKISMIVKNQTLYSKFSDNAVTLELYNKYNNVEVSIQV